MLPQIITYLLTFINYQEQVIRTLLTLLIGKSMFDKPTEAPVNKPYRKLQVDDLPIIEVPKKLDFQVLLTEHLESKGKPLKPVQRRSNSTPVPSSMKCPTCGAPAEYLYANNGAKGQYQCKVCSCLFSEKNRYLKEAILKCPHCSKTLEKVKERKDFHVYKCKNDACSYYQQKRNAMTQKEKNRFKEDPQAFKLRYIYRQFHIDFQPLAKHSPKRPRVDLSRIYVSPHTLGLILTYHVNYGLSARKTAALMKDVHGVSISHQSILNYENSVALWLKPYIDHYPYELSDQFCGDETYIRVNGRWHYLFFFFDAVKKVILSYPVSPNRDTATAIKAIDEVLLKLRKIPENLTFVVDGNPIYLLAQHFYAQHQIPFEVIQVIGLTNEDEVSKEYRPLKQIIERLNRTFKGNYRSTHGFGSEHGSVSFVTLFVAYFNFLRPHSALEGKVPVTIPELEKLPNMPARWTTLIGLAQDWISKQTA
ncbi:IS6 family transposase [Anaerobacillus isosaccharinicus]|uniref:DDE-type integrase/transposase/recombinase n=1 Tax=Anaerobacillus isosaccharinicus TaxID=1532552 RepID=A0A7S7LAA1_9BACI|nr:DDE-type integrase/transposase/recombinase [Anaerobacillus isosaccharinicus]MBA5584255.1 DDE-type integrase/transposase/recombinase [Anaerobacillus isosaccharinicus]MBA5584265.1 DDE-type integrase/transposase/recombinase [Anaerobacillus isosaccharinicus]MBA5584874.1 DDE-type integrase/transposase/recombinase [Anaerobacillus isosaccharinicus]MBA5587502.1 DDE-type integrase/transposase/recombinase [Anaerobacillus isosaccharinicus]QOY34316.1 DDE-type integrase/transposase/recombinase [Anaeroba